MPMLICMCSNNVRFYIELMLMRSLVIFRNVNQSTSLSWYKTWLRYSLGLYRSVVRLYDYFLASPFQMPLFVIAAILIDQSESGTTPWSKVQSCESSSLKRTNVLLRTVYISAPIEKFGAILKQRN